jgi:sialic acid synthase SpsE
MFIAEIGLNHLGSPKRLINYVNYLNETNIDALTVQIREPEYYSKNPKFELDNSDYLKIIKKLE